QTGAGAFEPRLTPMYPNAAPALLQPPATAAWWRQPTVEDGTPAATQTSTDQFAFWSLVAFTAILLLSPQIWFPALGALRIAFLAAGLAIGAHLLQRLADHPPVP